MESLTVGKRLVHNFIVEACSTLEIESRRIAVLYVQALPQAGPFEQLSTVIRFGGMAISEERLVSFVENSQPSSIRNDIYRAVHIIFQEQILKKPVIDYNGAHCFSIALGLTRAIPCPIPRMFDSMKPGIVSSMKTYFGLDVSLEPVLGHVTNGVQSYGARLLPSAEAEYNNKWNVIPHLTVRTISADEKGTEANPFDNVDEASIILGNSKRMHTMLIHF